MAKDHEAALLIAASEADANLFYATRFLAPDPFIFARIRGRNILVASDLELDRARVQAGVDEVVSSSKIAAKLKKRGVSIVTSAELVHFLFRERGVRHVLVPSDFPIQYADALRAKGYRLRLKRDPFFEERTIKSKKEVLAIVQTIRHTEHAVGEAVRILKKAKIRGRYLMYRDRQLTSEYLKQVINVALMESGCIAAHTIVACGKQGVDPHHQGSGPLLAHEPIIMDVFPRSSETRYFADMTRTVVRGKASPKLKKMYQAVKECQAIAFKQIRHGADGKKIHEAVQNHFVELGFKTGESDGRMQGFFHGTGHGVGLEIHEPPRISAASDVLRAGQVVTVEPGLYYLDAGGVRLEDIALVTQSGAKNLNRFPKTLEI
ncbi:MAG: Xaa-Pro aminopeptidase [Omnitrophica bacterium RIFCSPLOWO2_01_FULL_50_24]|nr:MAG: Xaa-Pro aminopeptidase [Omnitrophica bacterium RIFCSPLOWO2_01_FULL_50_24]